MLEKKSNVMLTSPELVFIDLDLSLSLPHSIYQCNSDFAGLCCYLSFGGH